MLPSPASPSSPVGGSTQRVHYHYPEVKTVFIEYTLIHVFNAISIPVIFIFAILIFIDIIHSKLIHLKYGFTGTGKVYGEKEKP